MSIQTVFSGAGGGQIVLYEVFTPGANATYIDTMGVGSTFNQPNAANQPALSLAPSGNSMMSFGGNDMMGDYGTGGIIDSADFVAWSGAIYVVESYLMYLPSSPDNATVMRIIDCGGDSWGRNFWGAGLVHKSNAVANAAMSALTLYVVSIEHNIASAVSTLAINNVAQTALGGNWSGSRADYLGYKLIGSRGDLSQAYVGDFGCWNIGWATTWGATERAALYAAMDEWWTGGGGGGGVTCTLSVPAAEQRRSALITVPENLIVLPRGLAEERRSNVGSTRISTMPFTRAEERIAGLVVARASTLSTPRSEEFRSVVATQASYQGTLAAPKAEERTSSVTSLSTYGVSLSGVGSSSLAPPTLASTSNTIVLPVAAYVTSTPSVVTTPGQVTLALAAILNRETSGTVTVIVGGGAPQTVILAAPAASEIRSSLSTTASYTVALPALAPAEQRSVVSSITAFTSTLGLTARESRAPSLTSQATYSVAFAATAAEQRASTVAAVASFNALLTAISAEERRTSVSQTSTYAVALAQAASTQATSFVTAGEFVNVTCAFVGIPSSSRVAPVTVVTSSPPGAEITWSFRPATKVVVTFGPATLVQVQQQRATLIQVKQHSSTKITVMQVDQLHVGDTNDIDFEFRDNRNPVVDEEGNVTYPLVDPAVVQIVVKAQADSIATIYALGGEDGVVTRLELGKYRAAIPCTSPGRWVFTIRSPGPPSFAEPGEFDVLPVRAKG